MKTKLNCRKTADSAQKVFACRRLLQRVIFGLPAVLGVFSSSVHAVELSLPAFETVCRSKSSPYEVRWISTPGHRRLTILPVDSKKGDKSVASLLSDSSGPVTFTEWDGAWHQGKNLSTDPRERHVVMMGDSGLFSGSVLSRTTQEGFYSHNSVRIDFHSYDSVSFRVTVEGKKQLRNLEIEFRYRDCREVPLKDGLPKMGVKNAEFSTVAVRTERSGGSMFAYKRDGVTYWITDSHVLKGKLPTSVTIEGQRIETSKSNRFELVYDNPEKDVVVLRNDALAPQVKALEWREFDRTGMELWTLTPDGWEGPLAKIGEDGEITSILGVPGPGRSGSVAVDKYGRFAGIYQRFQYNGLSSYLLDAKVIDDLIRERPKSKVYWDDQGRRAMDRLGRRFVEPSHRSIQDADGGTGDGDGGTGDGDGGTGDGGICSSRLPFKSFPLYTSNLRELTELIWTQVLVPTSPIQNQVLVDGVLQPIPARREARTWAETIENLTEEDLKPRNWLADLPPWPRGKEKGAVHVSVLSKGQLLKAPAGRYEISTRGDRISIRLSDLPQIGSVRATNLSLSLTEKSSTSTLGTDKSADAKYEDSGSGLTRQLFGIRADESVGHRIDVTGGKFQFIVRSGDVLWVIESQ